MFEIAGRNLLCLKHLSSLGTHKRECALNSCGLGHRAKDPSLLMLDRLDNVLTCSSVVNQRLRFRGIRLRKRFEDTFLLRGVLSNAQCKPRRAGSQRIFDARPHEVRRLTPNFTRLLDPASF
jgi:hypothetical protein